MDTGSIMANQMDDQITGAEIQREQDYDHICKDIASYILERGFTFSVEYIIEKYREKQKGYYVSHTTNQVISEFSDRLKKLL